MVLFVQCFLLETEKEKCEVEGMLMVCSDHLFGWHLVAKQISIFDSTVSLFILQAIMLGIVFSQFCYLFLHCM